MPTNAIDTTSERFKDGDAETVFLPQPPANKVRQSQSAPSAKTGSASFTYLLHGSYASGDTFELSALHFEFLLAQTTAPLNPCMWCELKRDVAIKFWSAVNLIVAIIQFCYKIWAAVMVFGGSRPDIRAARYFYMNYCTLDGKCLPFWTDRLGQASYVIGSFLLFCSAFKIRKLCKNRRKYAAFYQISIAIYFVASYVPQVFVWMFSKHCFPPGAAAVCIETVRVNSKVTQRLEAVPISLNTTSVLDFSSSPNRECLTITNSYFLTIYFLATFATVGWLCFGLIIGHSFLWWLKTPTFLLNSQSKTENRRKRLGPF